MIDNLCEKCGKTEKHHLKRKMCGVCYNKWHAINRPESHKKSLLKYKKSHRKQISEYENDRQRNMAIPIEIREIVINRANGACESCRGITKMMNIHHCDGVGNARGLKTKVVNNDISNLIYLCLRCHIKAHARQLQYARIQKKKQIALSILEACSRLERKFMGDGMQMTMGFDEEVGQMADDIHKMGAR
jgi:hypothetical protein